MIERAPPSLAFCRGGGSTKGIDLPVVFYLSLSPRNCVEAT